MKADSGSTDVDIRRIGSDQLIARPYARYKDTGLIALLDKLAWGSPLILKGAKGCLAGESEIMINRAGKGGIRITIEELMRKFHGGKSRGGKFWNPSIPTFAQIRGDDSCGRLGLIEDVVYAGEQRVFTVETESGRTIRATEKHPFLTENGWTRLMDLSPGDSVSCIIKQKKGPQKEKSRYKQMSGLGHPYAWGGEYPRTSRHGKARQQKVSIVPRHRVVAEARESGLSTGEFITRMRSGDHAGLVFLDPQKVHVHHIDGDHRNNHPDNLELVSPSEHSKMHADEGSYTHVLWQEEFETVVSIEEDDVVPTYDICMKDAPHNFTANGFVVHNSGKTMAVEQWAARNEVPFLRKSCTAETSDRHLLGGYILKSLDESFFSLGVLAAAIDVANEMGGCVLVLEEINALNEEAQKVVNSLADYRQEIDMPGIGRVYRLEENARVWVVGTMNPGYGGTYELNEDFRSRFKFVEVDFMPEATEKEILIGRFPTAPAAKEVQFVTRLMTLAKETRGGKYGYALSTRDLEQAVEDYLRLGSAAMALKMLEGKFEGAHVANYQARVRSTFSNPAIDLTNTALY